MAVKTIKQSVIFKASPHDVYEALIDAKKHAAFTGGKAAISRKVGGKFTVFDGYATGVNKELEQDKKIVQNWRADDWPEGVFSEVTFALAKVEGGTKLTFTQTGVPEDQFDDVARGWKEYYWGPMKQMLDK